MTAAQCVGVRHQMIMIDYMPTSALSSNRIRSSIDEYELRIMGFMVNSLPWQLGDSIRCTFRQCDSRYSHTDLQCACNLC